MIFSTSQRKYMLLHYDPAIYCTTSLLELVSEEKQSLEFEFSLRKLYDLSSMGNYSLRKSSSFLEEIGFIERIELHNERGKYSCSKWILHPEAVKECE